MRNQQPNKNMKNLEAALDMFLTKGISRFFMVMPERLVRDRFDRAFHALQGAGHPVIGSFTMRQITGGNQIKGMTIHYVSSHYLDQLRGQEGYVFVFEEDLHGRELEEAREIALHMNSRLPL